MQELIDVVIAIVFVIDADEPFEQNVVWFTGYENIIETVWDLLRNFEARRAMALQAHRWYRNTQYWTDIVDFNKLLPST